jgi:hypothetical protein
MSRTKAGTPELAAQMLRVLEVQRSLGGASYPLTLKRLAELTDPAAAPALVLKAAARKEFAERVAVVNKKNLDTPLALVEDLEQFASSGLLLEFVLDAICTPAQPGCPVSKLKTKVPAALKGPFEQAVRRQIREQTLPATVGFVQVQRTGYLYLQRLPYKPPALALAERLLDVLERRGSDGTPYPLLVTQLVELADPQAPAALVKKALAEEVFQQRALGALAKLSPESPVALAADLEQLADSPLVLETLLRAARTANSHAFPVTAWRRKVAPRLWPVFQESLRRRTEAGELPPSVCWVLFSKKLHYFLREDLQAGRTVKESLSVPPHELEEVPREAPADFEHQFDAAFDRLDRAKGAHNFVSLLDLRRALPLDRAAFDAGLNRLRFAQRYVVSAAEGRHGLSPEEREAGITEDGTLLLYVSRRKSS